MTVGPGTPVYGTKTKSRDSAAAPRRPEHADSCKRPKARGMAKSPAIARRLALVRWKLGGLVIPALIRRTNQERFMADCEAIAIGGRTVLKAENYACLQAKVSSTAKSPLL